MSTTSSIYVEKATWAEVEEAYAQDFFSILPIGAACKEHGLHLPLNTDYLQANWIAKQLTETYKLLVWPTVSYGFYPAFVNYPGSCSISTDAFIQSMQNLFSNICRHRDEHKLFLINTGISTIKPLQTAIEQSEFQNRVELINVYHGEKFSQVESAIQTQKAGGHADEIETSIMLALQPESVKMERAQAGMDTKIRGPLEPKDSTHPNYSPSGSIGDPTHASADKGIKLLAALLDDVKNTLNKKLT